MSFLFSCSLYLVSFMPLWVSVLFLDIKSICEQNPNLYTEYIGIGCISAFVATSLCVIFCKMHMSKQDNKKENTICGRLISAQEEKMITAEFLLSYILPLFAFDFTQWDSVVLFLIFFFTLGYLCIHHNYFCTSVILEMIGYKSYRCEIQCRNSGKEKYIVISRRPLNAHGGDDLYIKLLNNEYMLDIDSK